MNDMPSDKDIDGETQEHIRGEVKRVANGRPMTVVAKEADIPYGTFSSWMGGTYNGNTSRIATAAQRWIDAQSSKSRTRSLMPVAPSYFETPTSREFLSALDHAQYAPEFVMITGGAGVGKTTTIEHHQLTNPAVFILTGEPCFNTPRMLLDCLAQVLDLPEKYSSQTVSRAIQRRLKGSGGLVIVDEAQHLSSQSLDQMRTLHDLARVGVALVGNETVYTRLEGQGRQPQYAQLYSRVGMRVSRTKPLRDDIKLLLDAWKVEGAEERKLLTGIARHPGALRGVTKTLKQAHMLAGGQMITCDTIRMAWERISGTQIMPEKG